MFGESVANKQQQQQHQSQMKMVLTKPVKTPTTIQKEKKNCHEQKQINFISSAHNR